MSARWTIRLTALALLVFATTALGGRGGAVATAYAANRSLSGFTFAIHGTIAMHTFPWLHFRIQGRGRYERGRVYDVRLTHLPFFARGFNHMDLSALAPSVWRTHYVVSFAGSRGGDDYYTLHDPHDPTLRVATVRVDPARGIQEVRLQYKNGGLVDLHVSCVSRQGYLVPGTSQAQIDVPSAHLSVSTTFGDYALAGRSVVGSAHIR